MRRRLQFQKFSFPDFMIVCRSSKGLYGWLVCAGGGEWGDKVSRRQLPFHLCMKMLIVGAFGGRITKRIRGIHKNNYSVQKVSLKIGIF